MKPIVFQTAGDQYPSALHITSILWDATTSDGDRAIIADRVTGQILWIHTTNAQNTSHQPNLGSGISAPNGIRVSQLDGTLPVLIVYPREK